MGLTEAIGEERWKLTEMGDALLEIASHELLKEFFENALIIN
ncbi:MAG: hypothetical protein ACFFAS_11625 [Promethearchaeota archaeon]